jgi:hypothetical protein
VAIVRPYEPIGVWIGADYLLEWIKGGNVPALVTAGIPPGAGVVGPAGGETLFNGGEVDHGAMSGGRFTLGFWLTDAQVIGLEGSYFFLGQDSTRLAEGTEDPSDPAAPPGTFFVTSSSLLQSAEVNLIAAISNDRDIRLKLLGGFRFVQLDEKLHVEQEFVTADMSEDDTWVDDFRTKNQFYGGQIGAKAEYNCERFFADARALVALGASVEHASISGTLNQAVVTGGFDQFGNPISVVHVTQSPSGGLFANPGTFSKTRFAVIPELNVDVGYQFTPHIRGAVGYNFLYWSNVLRPGDVVSGTFKSTDFWAQGLNFTLGFTF